MWSLQKFDQPDTVYHLISGKEYIVGRKDCDINIENDKSISRKHAVLTVTHHESNVCTPANLPVLQVEDVSKYGTYVNKIQINKHKIIKNGDEIKFGGLNSKFKVNYQALVVTTSSLKNIADKGLIKNCLSQLGGHFVLDWKIDNTHLIMSSLVVTIKAVCALLSAKPIVTPQYLEELLKFLGNGGAEPKLKDYLPQLGEATLIDQNIDFTPSEIRKKLFIGKTFLFASSKQESKLKLPINLGGGETVLISSPPIACYLGRPGVCVVNPSEPATQSSVNSWIQSAEKTLKRHSRRLIPESEIGLAAVYCSTEKYCNPDFQIVPETMNLTSQTQIGDTQSSLFSASGNNAESLSGLSPVAETFRQKSLRSTPSVHTNIRKHSRNHEDNAVHRSKIPRLESHAEEDEDLFGDPNESIQVINEEGEENMEVETITLDYVPPTAPTPMNKSPSEESQEIDISFANSNWTPGKQPNLESTRKPDEIEKDVNMGTSSQNENNNFTIIEYKSLVILPARPYRRELRLNAGENFKNFKKAQPLKSRSTNISQTDMEMYQNPDHEMTIGWTQDHARLTTDQGTQDEDLFDWEPKRKGRR